MGSEAAPPQAPRPPRSYWKRLWREKEQILNIRAALAQERTWFESALVAAAHFLANPLFFVAEVLFHLGWVLLNGYALHTRPRWDPYPSRSSPAWPPCRPSSSGC